MKKILLSVAMVCMAMSGYAETTDAYVGWPANYDGVMLQGFWWDSYDATKWSTLTARADELSQYFDLIWVPNAGTTSTGKWAIDHGNSIPQSMGYDPCYWLEYNTIFGTEDELKAMIAAYAAKNVGIIEDVVINHKNGVSGWCDFPNEEDVIGPKTGTTYSITWDNENYSAICKNDECNSNGYPTTGDNDTGDNFDGYRDLDHKNTQVQENIKTYVKYLKDEMGFAGFRYDMVKGYGAGYINTYNNYSKPTYSVGEYWDDQTPIQDWIANTAYSSAAFDFPLKWKLNRAISGGDYSALDWKSFTFDPNFSRYSVTFVDNHDTGREDYYKLVSNWSAANAFILASPGTPCIWLTHYEADKENIGKMILARKACRITNTGCEVLKQYSTENNTGYILETQGSAGKVYVQFGAAADDGTPDGYNLVASGDSYKFYSTATVSTEPNITVSPTGGTFYTETQTVTLTPNSFVTSAWYKIGNNDAVTFSGKTTVTIGENVASGTTITLSWGANNDAVTGSASFQKVAATTESVYLSNTANWSQVYCYAWNGEGQLLGNWPGTQVTANSDGKYQQDFTGEYPTFVIWNSGSSAQQTADLSYLAGTTYTNGSADATVYLNNTAAWEHVYCYAWNGEGQLLGNWPGTEITTKTNDNYEAVIAGNPSYVIWNDGNGTQTGDLSFEANKVYTNGQIVYLNNEVGWETVNCYAWNGDNKLLGAWPGTTINQKNANGYYYAMFSDAIPAKIIWNNGTVQTPDLDFEANKLYTNAAEITSVTIAGGFNSWSNTSDKLVASGEYTWTYSLDLSSTTEDMAFKLLVNGTWLGYDDVTRDAPNGWLESSDGDILLKNSSTHYMTYLITATWTPSVAANAGWKLKVEGVVSRNTATYTVAGFQSLLETEWDPTNTNNDMSLSADGTYYELIKLVYLRAGTYEFKVVKNHNWNQGSYPDNNWVLNIESDGLYEGHFYFHPFTDNSVTVDFRLQSELNIEDGISFIASGEFTASKATYSRSFKNNWGTLCLPFKIKNTYEGVTFYTLSSVDTENKELTFTQVSSVGAGQPIVFKLDDNVDLNISESNVNVVTTAATSVAVNGWTLNGTFRELANQNASDGQYLYYIASNQFWQGTNTTIPAYRAWFTTTADLSASLAPFRIVVSDGTEDLNVIEQEDGSIKIRYDMLGRRIQNVRKGLMIENGKLIFVK